MEIKKVYKETLPTVKLIGKKFTNSDRDQTGTFASYWQEAFKDNWFETLSQCSGVPDVGNDYIGAMRTTSNNEDDFEYWIGMLCSPEADVPDTFESVEIPSGELGICWLYGNDKTGELYSMEAFEISMTALKNQGWRFNESGWFFERYNSPRFTESDANGNVILDICTYLV